MPLTPGSRLGPYEILAPIGAGGMGEVYRAKDARLGRDVAIKVLPASFSADPDRLRRFELEARAAGVLNHPNITAVHDIGLREEPADLSVTNANISPGLDRIVRHALEKNPEQRFHSAHDVAFALDALSDVSAPRPGSSKSGIGIHAHAPARLPSRLAMAAILAAVAIGILAGRLIWKAPPETRPSFHRLTFRRGPVQSARFAPDGNTIIYSAQWDGAPKAELYSTRIENPESLKLALPEGKIEAISRAGEMLVLSSMRSGIGYAAAGTLSQAPLSGSASRAILEDVASAEWSPDGASQAVVRAPQWRYRLEFPAGKVLYETTGYISHPRISSKGDAIAFLDHPFVGDDRGAVAVIDLAGKKKTLSDGWESVQGLAWSASGKEIWFTATRAGSSRALYAVSLAGRERAVLAAPAGLLLQDISRDGRVLLDQSNARVGMIGLIPGEAKERDLSNLEWSNFPRLFEDGKSIAFSEQGEAGGPGYSVYLRKLDGSAAVRLGEGNTVAVSPDGKWVLTNQIRTTPATLVLLPTGAGQPKTFPKDSIDRSGSVGFGAFLPDGKRIAFNGHETGKPPRVFVQGLDGGAARPVTPEGVTAR
ncbi:MAG: hypothetical protein LC796_17780, partial [Acidobacteria bacterium]|nr:hypothetical protein [Acidobacteriota bacterium]